MQKKGLCLFLALVLVVALFPAMALAEETVGTVYYVNSVTGNDDNSGQSPSEAWASLTKVNAQVFQPGDQILFAAGSTYTGRLNPKGSGTADAPILIDSYGEGDMPRIDGNGIEKEALLLESIEYWEVRGLEITNFGSTGSSAQQNRKGVRITAIRMPVMRHIVLDGLYVHDVNGSLQKHNTQEGAGIYFEARSGGSQTPYFDGLTIENCYIKSVDRNGIGQYYDFAYHPWGHGSWDAQTAEPIRSINVVIRNNVLEDIGGDGIKPWGSDAPLIESNLLMNGCQRTTGSGNLSAGIWPFDCNNSVFQYNEVCFTSNMNGGNGDAQAFDSDYYCANTLFQYNYSHNNQGGFLMICGPEYAYTDGTVFRYNISQNDGSKYNGVGIFQIGGGGGVDHSYIYNNTIYTGPEHSLNYVMTGGAWDGNPKGTNFLNNIFYINGDVPKFGFAGVSGDAGKAGIVSYDSNLYYGTLFAGDGPSDKPNDPNGIFGVDPMLVNPGGGGMGLETATAYMIQEGSPCIGAGAVINKDLLGQKLAGVEYRPGNTTTPVDKEAYFYLTGVNFVDVNGGRDFFGNPLPEGAPDIGAHQFVPEAGGPTVSEFTVGPNIMEGFAANLSVNIAGEDLGDLILNFAGADYAVTEGAQMIYVEKAPDAGTYPVKLLMDGKVIATANLTVLAYEPASLWKPTAYWDKGIVVEFSENISSLNGFASNVDVGGNLPVVQTGNKTLKVLWEGELPDVEPQWAVISGVKYAELFPSYSFTFTITVGPLPV